MRAALLPPLSDEILEPLALTLIGAAPDEALSACLKLPTVREKLVAIAPHERLEHVLGRALALPPVPDDGVVLLQLAAFRVLTPEAWSDLDVGDGFRAAARASDDDVEREIAVASRDLDEGDLDEAARHYHAADALLQHEVSPRHAEVLSSLGEVARARDRIDEARSLFDRALSIFPVHQGALRARAVIAQQTAEYAIAAAMLHRLVLTVEDPTQQVDLLAGIAAQSLEAARDAIERALAIVPGDRRLLERLQAVDQAAGRWAPALAVAVQLAEGVPEPARRARAFLAAADLCAEHLGNPAQAVALYEAAIEDDPTVERAFAAVEITLLSTGDFAGVASAYERQLARLEAARALEPSLALLERLALLQRDRLGDPHAAIRALHRISELRPADTRARAELARLLDFVGDLASAVRCLEVSAEYEPWRPETYRSLYALFSKAQDQDRGYSACGALVALGAADIDEQLIHAQFAPEAPHNFGQPFASAVWHELCPRTFDIALGELIQIIEPAALDAWLAAKEPAGPVSALPDKKFLQDPKKTTVSAVRSFVWACRLLGVPEPRIYARPDDTRLGVVTVPGDKDSILLGRSILSGRSPVELAFLAVHHLAYYRPGFRLLQRYTELGDLEALVRAALTLGDSKVFPWDDLDSGAKAHHAALDARLETEERGELLGAVGRLVSRGGTLDLPGFRRGAETMACRAALLASGDATVAGTVLSMSGAHVGGLTAADRTRDLLAFSVGEAYARLRRGLGIGVG